MSRAAFTLMELLIVVVIVGILAAMAIPQFGKTTERSYQRQAWDMLQTIYAGEQVYFSTNNTYCNPTIFGAGSCVPGSTSGTTWGGIYMDNPTTTTTTYAFSGVTAATFTATATRTGGTLCNSATMTINQLRTRAGGVPNWQTCPMPL